MDDVRAPDRRSFPLTLVLMVSGAVGGCFIINSTWLTVIAGTFVIWASVFVATSLVGKYRRAERPDVPILSPDPQAVNSPLG